MYFACIYVCMFVCVCVCVSAERDSYKAARLHVKKLHTVCVYVYVCVCVCVSAFLSL